MGDDRSYLVFAWTPSGYELREEQGEPPQVGTEVLNGDGKSWHVVKVGASPLPGDERPCAYLQG